MTENETKLLQAITLQPGGLDIHEIMEQTGLTHDEILDTFQSLLSHGVQVTAMGIRGEIRRIYLSKYDDNYNKLMQGEF